MAAIRERQKQQLRAEIVRSAFELFGREGFDQTPVEAICAAAGISRATFFNYFPQKELILREIAKARVAKLKVLLDRFGSEAPALGLKDIVKLFLDMSRENARVGAHSKRLLLETTFRVVSSGSFRAARAEAIEALTTAMERVPVRPPARLVAETLFAIYIATTLEWLMTPAATSTHLLRAMRARLELALKGIA